MSPRPSSHDRADLAWPIEKKLVLHDPARLCVTSWEQTAPSQIDRSKAPVCEEAMSDILRRKRLGRTALLGSVLLALLCMALFGAARFFVA